MANLELYDIDPKHAHMMRSKATGTPRSILITTGVVPALAAYLLPIVRAFYLNGFDVGILCLSHTGIWLHAARDLWTDFTYHVRCDFKYGEKDMFYIRELPIWMTRSRDAFRVRRVSWISRNWPGYTFYSDPYVDYRESHVFRGMIKQCRVSQVPQMITDPLETVVPEGKQTINSTHYDTPDFNPPGNWTPFPNTSSWINVLKEYLGAKSVKGAPSFPVLLRVMTDRETYIVAPHKNVPKWSFFDPCEFPNVDLSDMQMTHAIPEKEEKEEA